MFNRSIFQGGELLPQVLEGLETGVLPQRLQHQRAKLHCCASLEAACQALDVGRVADAQRHLAAAERCLGVSSEVTGKPLCSQPCFKAFSATSQALQQQCKAVSGCSGKVTGKLRRRHSKSNSGQLHCNGEPTAPLEAGLRCTDAADVEAAAGALGVRTVHQTDARAQLVLRTTQLPDCSSRGSDGRRGCSLALLHDLYDTGSYHPCCNLFISSLYTGVSCSGDEAEWLDAVAQGMPDQAGARTNSNKASHANGSSVRAKELEGLTGDSDVLLVPKLETADGEPTCSFDICCPVLTITLSIF